MPNRLRISRKFKNNDKTLHIEAHELFRTNKEGKIELIPGEVAMTIALRGTRRFGFWDLNGADLKQQGMAEMERLDAEVKTQTAGGQGYSFLIG